MSTDPLKEMPASYGAAFADPKYLKTLIQKAQTLTETEFLSVLKEGVHVFRLPLIVFQGLMNMRSSAKDGSEIESVVQESRRLQQHLNDLMAFIKAYESRSKS